MLLKEIEKNSAKTVTTLVNRLSKTNQIPISTLKLNARILKELGLVNYANFNSVELTEAGKLVLELIR